MVKWLRRVGSAVSSIYETEGDKGVRHVFWALEEIHADFGFQLAGGITPQGVSMMADTLSSIRASQLIEALWWAWRPDDKSMWIESTAKRNRIAELAREVLDIAPDDPYALTALATAQVVEAPEESLNLVKRAEKARNRAGLAIHAGDLAVTVVALHLLEQTNEAQQELDRLREIAAASDSAREYLVAAETFVKSIADGLVWLGNRGMRAGRFVEAESWFRRHVERAGLLDQPYRAYRLALAKGHVGWALMKQGQFAEAEPLLLEAFEAFDNPEQLFQIRDEKRESCERLVELYKEWNRAAPSEIATTNAGLWSGRAETLRFATRLEGSWNIDNVLIKSALPGCPTDYDEWKRVRTFIRLVTGDWTEDPILFDGLHQLVADAIHRVGDDREAQGADGIIWIRLGDQSSKMDIVSHAALCVLDGRLNDADGALSRAVDDLAPDNAPDEALRLLQCQAAVKEALGRTGAAHSLYRRVAVAVEAHPSGDPVRLAVAGLEAAATDSGDGRFQELSDAVEILTSHLAANDPRVIRGVVELGQVMGWSREPEVRERAEFVFEDALKRAEQTQDLRPLLYAEVLRRYGEWLAWQGRAPSRAVGLLESAVASYGKAGLISSPQMASALQWLSRARFDDGEYRSAAESMRESLEIRLSLGEARVCTGSDEGRLQLLLDASDGLAAAGDLADAERSYRAAVSIAERDGDGWYTKEARSCLGEFLSWIGRKAEAASLQNQVPSNDPTNPVSYVDRLVRCCRNIAARMLRSREVAESERVVAIVQRGMSILDAANPESVFVAWWKAELDILLGDALVVKGSFERAEPLLLSGYHALAICQNVPMEPRARDRAVREAHERIVRLYDAWHIAEPARGADAKAAEWRARVENTAPASAPASQP
jgi:tetratricopeptide (TPR) repeat protein